MSKNISFIATAIGSLPHTSPKDAVNLVFETLPDMPVIPQLAKVNQNEDMSSQLNERIPGVVYDEADKRWYMDQESETFFEELEEFKTDVFKRRGSRDTFNMLRELIQTAAMCQRAAEDLNLLT